MSTDIPTKSGMVPTEHIKKLTSRSNSILFIEAEIDNTTIITQAQAAHAFPDDEWRLSDVLEIMEEEGVGNCEVEDYFNGSLSSAYSIKDGKRHGLCEAFYLNGNITHEITYVNGQEHGICRGWHPNRKVRYNGRFKKGKRDGTWREYHPNGEPYLVITYRNGTKTAQQEYDKNGKVIKLDSKSKKVYKI